MRKVSCVATSSAGALRIPAVARSWRDWMISPRVGHPWTHAEKAVVHVKATRNLVYVFILAQ